MNRSFLVPLVALSALTTEAAASVPTTDNANKASSSLASKQLQDAQSKGLVLYSVGEDAFAFMLVPAADGTLMAAHSSHSSHSSHASHASHSSHVSGY